MKKHYGEIDLPLFIIIFFLKCKTDWLINETDYDRYFKFFSIHQRIVVKFLIAQFLEATLVIV